METSSEVDLVASALSTLQFSIEDIKKKSSGYNYKYADLAEVWSVIRPHLKETGLSFTQLPFNDEGVIGIETIIMHKSGQFLKQKFGSKPAQPDNPQDVGKLLTYYRRYALIAACGLAPVDDDAASNVPDKYRKTLVPLKESPSPQAGVIGKTQEFELNALVLASDCWTMKVVKEVVMKVKGPDSFNDLNRVQYDWVCQIVEKSTPNAVFKVLATKGSK